MNLCKRGAVFVAAFAIVGCAQDAPWAGSIVDSAGVQIVQNPDVGIWGPDDAWSLQEDLRIGAIDGDVEHQFGSIGGIAVDSKSRIFVLDAQARNVRVFAKDGTYEQTIGQPGSGPGELGAVATLFVGPGDTLLVPDFGNQRVNRYAPDGASLGSFPLRFEQGIPMAINATRTGVIVEQLRPLSRPDRPAPDTLDVIVTLGTDGSVLDTITTFPSGGALDLSNEDGPRRTLFAPEPVWTLADDMRLFQGITSDYRIKVYAPDGRLQRIFSKAAEPTPVTERDQEMIWTVIEETIREAVPPTRFAEVMQLQRQTTRFADFFPQFVRLSVGPAGTVWVQHLRPPSSVTEAELETYDMAQDIGARDWDVFDRDGRYLGVVTMPPRFAPRVVLDDMVYGVWRDDLDVQYMVRLRVLGLAGE